MHVEDAAYKSIKGRDQAFNEDATIVLGTPPLAVVADGMGGPGAGNVASSIALVAFQERAAGLARLARQADSSSKARLAVGRELERLIEHIHDQVATSARTGDRFGMGTTLVTTLIAGSRAHLAHVGAARAYLFRDEKLRALTEDHTVGMVRVRQELMSPGEYRTSPLSRRLYQALGTGSDVDVDVAEVALADGDWLMLCSDGVHTALDDETIGRCLARASDAEEACALLLAAVQATGGTDDATVAVQRVVSDVTSDLVDEIASVLADTFLFKGLSETERSWVAPYLDHEELSPGQVLFREGDEADAFYVVIDGLVSITKGDTLLVEIGAGGSFGELCLARPVRRSATVTATEETLVFGLSRERFHEVLARRPAVGNKLLLAALDHVGIRLRDLTDRLAVVEALATKERSPGALPVLEAITRAAEGKLG